MNWRGPWDPKAGTLESSWRGLKLCLRVIYNCFRRWRINRCLRRAAWLCAKHERPIVTDIGRIIARLDNAERIERNAVHIMVTEDTAAINAERPRR
jgi:hypothetical protein